MLKIYFFEFPYVFIITNISVQWHVFERLEVGTHFHIHTILSSWIIKWWMKIVLNTIQWGDDDTMEKFFQQSSCRGAHIRSEITHHELKSSKKSDFIAFDTTRKTFECLLYRHEIHIWFTMVHSLEFWKYCLWRHFLNLVWPSSRYWVTAPSRSQDIFTLSHLSFLAWWPWENHWTYLCDTALTRMFF